MNMLDLQAQYQPARKTSTLKPESTAVYKPRKPIRQNSFNQVLDKASQLKSKKSLDMNIEPDQSSSTRVATNEISKKLPNNHCEPQAALGLRKIEEETCLLKPEIILPNNAQEDLEKAMDQTETGKGEIALEQEVFKLACIAAENPSPGNPMTIVCDTSITSKDGSQSQVESLPQEFSPESALTSSAAEDVTDMGLDHSFIRQQPEKEGERLSAVPAEPESTRNEERLDTKDKLAIAKSSVMNELKTGVHGENQNQAFTGENQLPIDKAVINPPILPDQTAVNKPYNEQSLADEKMVDKVELLQPAPQGNEKTAPTEAVKGFIISTPQNTAEIKLSRPQSKQEEAPVSMDESRNNTGMDQGEKPNMPENIRLKLLEKLLDQSRKSNDHSLATDIKKLLGEEIQRVRGEKTGLETNDKAEPVLTKNQPEVSQSGMGAEKFIFSSTRSEMNTQVIKPEGLNLTVDPQDIIEQIVKKAEIINKAANSEMQIQLKPEFLGKVLIRIAVDDGVVTARFITENQQVKHLLEMNLGSLKQNLESQGFKVDRTEVNVQLDNGGAFHGNDSGRQQMWQEYADRNSYARYPYQASEDYNGIQDISQESYGETDTIQSSTLLGDGKLDFMI